MAHGARGGALSAIRLLRKEKTERERVLTSKSSLGLEKEKARAHKFNLARAFSLNFKL